MKLLCTLMCVSASLNAMEQQVLKLNTVYHVPADPNKIFNEVSYSDLSLIKDSQELSSSKGIISALVIRPKESERMLVNSFKINRNGIDDDRHQKGSEPRLLDAVTMIRADISQALGGAHIPGDNIHVEGLSFNRSSILPGTLLIITNPISKNINVILMKTYIPHYGCWKLKSRCGQEAFDLMNAEGSYEKGFLNFRSELVHGLLHQLRGMRLFVLKEGTISIGDEVHTASSYEKVKVLEQYSLINDYKNWIDASKPLGAQKEKEEEARRALRQRIRDKKEIIQE